MCEKFSIAMCEKHSHKGNPHYTHTHAHAQIWSYSQIYLLFWYLYMSLSYSVIPAVSLSSSDDLTVDSIIRKPLLVAPSVGAKVILYVVVSADPCPSIQWRLNGSAVSNGGNYIIGNPCSSAPAGTITFNFTLTITANSATTGTYNATLTNAAGTREVPDVFVTPPGILG